MPEFTPEGYYEFLSYICDRFSVRRAEGAHCRSKDADVVIRHDVDISLGLALLMAKLEYDMGVATTYHVMVDSPCYELEGDVVREIVSLGHEVGLHVGGVDRKKITRFNSQRIINKVEHDREILGAELGHPPTSVSFHSPGPDQPIIGEMELVGYMVNCHASKLRENYLADSRGTWNCNPYELLDRIAGEKRFLQAVIHPVWWFGGLQKWYDITVESLDDDDIRDFDEALSDHCSACKWVPHAAV
jgi:hypothetical protein